MALSADMRRRFDLTDRVAVITGGAGLLGLQHARAIAAAGGVPVLVDLEGCDPVSRAGNLASELGTEVLGYVADITQPVDVRRVTDWLLAGRGRIDILINNAANNPRAERGTHAGWARMEALPLEAWRADIDVGLTGAFLCSQMMGAHMAQRRKGVILNVASDLALISPDQRIYREPGRPEDEQPAKPISYSVVKAGLIGMTRWLSTWWASEGVRVNAISPGGVANGQPDEFVQRLVSLVPLGRMALIDEYQAAVMFLCSDASSYMTGANLVIDGGRTVW